MITTNKHQITWVKIEKKNVKKKIQLLIILKMSNAAAFFILENILKKLVLKQTIPKAKVNPHDP